MSHRVALVVFALSLQPLGVLAEKSPGHMISVGDHRLHAHVLGEGEPTLVLDTGMGDSIDAWGELPSRLAEKTRVVVYDRAGIGESDLAVEPRVASTTARELGALLDGLDIGSVVLVGHSLAGLHIRAFAHLYPERVAGLVFLDPTTEGMHRSLATDKGRQDVSDQLVDEPEGIRAEGESLWPSLVETEAIGPPPDVPAIVVTGMAPPSIPEEYREEAEAMGVDLARLRELQQIKLDLHIRLVESLPRGKHILAPAGNHYVHWDEPDLVVDSIEQLVDSIRTSDPGGSD